MNAILEPLGLHRPAPSSSLSNLTMMAAGVFLGSALTMLLAPRLRREIRDELAERARRLREGAAEGGADRVLTEI